MPYWQFPASSCSAVSVALAFPPHQREGNAKAVINRKNTNPRCPTGPKINFRNCWQRCCWPQGPVGVTAMSRANHCGCNGFSIQDQDLDNNVWTVLQQLWYGASPLEQINNHGITESFELEGMLKGHLIQSPAMNRHPQLHQVLRAWPLLFNKAKERIKIQYNTIKRRIKKNKKKIKRKKREEKEMLMQSQRQSRNKRKRWGNRRYLQSASALTPTARVLFMFTLTRQVYLCSQLFCVWKKQGCSWSRASLSRHYTLSCRCLPGTPQNVTR